MKQKILINAAILGASGVALGALAAHALKNRIGTDFSVQQFDAFETATKYQLLHAIALLAIHFYNSENKFRWLNRCAALFISGTLLFSGSIYFLSTQNLMGIQLPKFIGILTPIGGLLLIAGWLCLAGHALNTKST